MRGGEKALLQRKKAGKVGRKSRWSQFRGWAPEKVQEQGWGLLHVQDSWLLWPGGEGSSRPQDWEGAAQGRGSDLRGKNSQLSWPAHALPVLHSFAPSRTQCHLLWPAHLPQARLVSTLLTRTWQATMCPAASGHAEDRGEASWGFSGLCTIFPMPFPSRGGHGEEGSEFLQGRGWEAPWATPGPSSLTG